MKILLLNPLVDAGQQMLRILREKGFGVLVSSDATEAYEILKLHHRTIELAIIHREDVQGNGEPGLHFIDLIKKDPQQADLPYIITSAKWSPGEWAMHQGTPQGANAYLPLPGGESRVMGTLERIFGEELYSSPLGTSTSIRPAAMAATFPSASGPIKSASDASGIPELVLEDVATLFETLVEKSTLGSIRLEMPDFDDEPKGSHSSITPPSESGSVPLEMDAPIEDLLVTRVLPSSLSEPVNSEPADPGPILVAADDFGEVLELSPPTDSSPPPTEGYPIEMDAKPSGLALDEPETAFEAVGEEAEEPFPVVARKKKKRPRPEPEDEYEDSDDESIIARDMPYLFGAGSQGVTRGLVPGYDFIQPMGDAVVPGGAVNSPDVETLKKYLLLREGDVAALSTQLKLAREQVGAVEEALQLERARSTELQRVIEDQERRIEEFEKEKTLALEGLHVEIDELKFQTKAKADRARVLDSHVRAATEEMERLKERVRADIRKIRVREKELENRLEIMKKDSEALIGARENKIIELKRKVDLLEFNMDLLQDQHAREKENSAKVKDRLARALQAVRVAGGLLDSERPAVSRRKDDEDTGPEAESA